MHVISLFDGVACARLALEKNNITIDSYFASEVDKYAIETTRRNRPDTIHIGDVRGVAYRDGELTINFGESPHFDKKAQGGVDLLIGGSPCQDLSIAKIGRKGLDGERSGLFYEYLRILKESKPKYFVLENVASMPKEARATITKEIGVEPILINAALVSGQNRKRLFWTNIPGVTQPEDRGIYLKDVLLSGETDDLKSLCLTATYHKKNEQNYLQKRDDQMVRIGDIGSNAQSARVYSPEGKSVALSAQGGGRGAKTGLYIVQRPRGKNTGGEHHEKSPTVTSSSFEHNNFVAMTPINKDGTEKIKSNTIRTSGMGSGVDDKHNWDTLRCVGVDDGHVLRKLHPIECERLQGMPDNWTEGVSNTQRYKMCGNAFNVDVVAHILSFIPR